MRIFKLYEKDNVKFELVFNKESYFFFRLGLPNISYNYRNPLLCVRLALKDSAKARLEDC